MDFTSRHAHEFSKLFHKADARLRPFEVFDVFIDCAFLAYRQAVHVFIHRQQDAELESLYLDRIQQVKNPSVIADMFGLMVMGLTEKPHDFLGEVYMVNEFGNGSTGQFFTPHSLSELMASMQLAGLEKGNQRYRINDNSSGSGSTLITTVRHLRDAGFDNSDFLLIAEDIDLRCCKMAYIQFTALDVPAIVRHQNTLSNEVFDQWQTFAFVRCPFEKSQGSIKTDATESETVEVETVEREAVSAGGQYEFQF